MKTDKWIWQQRVERNEYDFMDTIAARKKGCRCTKPVLGLDPDCGRSNRGSINYENESDWGFCAKCTKVNYIFSDDDTTDVAK